MTDYDPLVTMAALNMAVVSLHRITSTGDRVILDREYTGIINNLRMGKINADPELTGLYQGIVRVIQAGRLRDKDRAYIESEYSQQKQKGIKEIVSGSLGKTFSTTPIKWLGRLAAVCVSEYFRSRARAEVRREGEQFRLRKEELAEYGELQRKLLGASWNLLRQYGLPDSCLLTQGALGKFYAAMQEDNPSKRLRMLKYLDGEFGIYSPYWFYRAKAAQNSGDIDEARRSFGKFGEVWRPVLRRDPYRAEAVKFRIGELVSEGLSEENAEEILRCLAEVRENSELEDWANNIYMGMMYFALGMKNRAIECVMCNIDFGFETENSGKLLAKFESETPPKKFAEIPAKSPEKPVKVSEVPKPVQEASKPKPEVQKAPKPVKVSLKERAEKGDSEAQYQLGVSYAKKEYLLEYLFSDYAFVSVLCLGLAVGSGVFYFMRSPSFWWNILIFAGSVFSGLLTGSLIVALLDDKVSPFYRRRAKLWLTKAAENGHTEAMYRLAAICSNNHEPEEAERWYKNAAVRGHIASQKALAAMRKYFHSFEKEGYMWAYLAYLCGGTENLGNKPDRRDYNFSDWDSHERERAEDAEAEAQKMFTEIQRRKHNTNS